MIPRALRTCLLLTSVAACGLGSAAGQVVHTLAYPQETTTEPDGDFASFGFDYTPPLFGTDESRYQMLIPATHVPTIPTAILGLEVICQSHTGAVIYTMLEITLANSAISTLSTVFDTNLHAATRVLIGAPVTVTFATGQWSRIAFQQPFFHDGARPIVIEVRKAIDRSLHPPPHRIQIQGPNHPIRTDLPSCVFDTSSYGGGAYFASTGWAGASFSFIKVRLVLRDLPTLSLRSDLFGAPGGVFRIGGQASISVQASAGSSFWVFGDGAFQSALLLPPIQGSLLVMPSVIAFSGITGASGVATLSSGIPVNPALIGQRAAFQSLVLSNGTLQLSNATDALLNR